MNDIQSGSVVRRPFFVLLLAAISAATAPEVHSANAPAEPVTTTAEPTYYYQCTIKRDPVLNRQFNKEHRFPVSPRSAAPYGFSGSLRWSTYAVRFDGDGEMTIRIEERIGGETVKAIEKRRVGRIPQDIISDVVVELVSSAIVVPYRIDCGPERR